MCVVDFVVNHLYFNPMINDVDKDHIVHVASVCSIVKQASLKKYS